MLGFTQNVGLFTLVRVISVPVPQVPEFHNHTKSNEMVLQFISAGYVMFA